MKFSPNVRRIAGLVGLCALLSPLAAQEIDLTQTVSVNGWPKPIPVNLSGFSGEVDATLRQDLILMGVAPTSPAQATYSVTGSNSGRVEGSVTDKISKSVVLAKAYTGGSLRSQAHAFADDIAKALTGKPGIAQTRVAFKVETGGAGHGEIYVADFDGRNAVPLTQDHAIVAAPAWASSDKLLYCSYKLGAPAIYSQLLSSGARASVARYPGGNFSPAVSQDGHRVAMILSKNGSPDLYVANVDGSGLKQLTFTKEAESSPCWSPDNQTICYCSRQNGGVASLFKISASGGSPSRLQTTGAPSPTEPDWSPDGRWIAFTSLAGSFQICIVAASGGEAIVLVPGEDPSWAPNSRAIIFCAGSDHAKHLSLLDVPTRRVNSLGRILESNSQPSWAR